jgi:hypothetical protein
MTQQFECNQCGACCKSIRLSEETIYLDRGDGVCRYFDDNQNTCTIYENRPDICNVRVMYEQRYQHQMNWSEFTKQNKLACDALLKNIQVKPQ